jgi:hypothetical protein
MIVGACIMQMQLDCGWFQITSYATHNVPQFSTNKKGSVNRRISGFTTGEAAVSMMKFWIVYVWIEKNYIICKKIPGAKENFMYRGNLMNGILAGICNHTFPEEFLAHMSFCHHPFNSINWIGIFFLIGCKL